MTGYALHPEAFADLDDIRGFIADANPAAADRLITEIFDQIRALTRFPIRAIDARILPRGLCASREYENT
jgi:plasmid stabilization system protein ParE